MNDIIFLLSEKRNRDEYGDIVKSFKSREVFCDVSSISQREFYEAQANGLKPEIKFILSDYYDYRSEKKIMYCECVYTVIRTFRTGKKLEIVCTREINQHERTKICY